MKAYGVHFLGGVVFLSVCLTHAADPVVSNVRVSQQAGKKLVDIKYDVSDSDSANLMVSVAISTNDGTTYNVSTPSMSDGGSIKSIGVGVTPGLNRWVTWSAGADWDGMYSSKVRVKVTADDSTIPKGIAVAIVGVNGQPTTTAERVAIVALNTIPSGTVLHFTDCGWSNHYANAWHRLTEFHTGTLTASQDIVAGSVMEIGLNDINSGGDQVAIYQYEGDGTPTNNPEKCRFIYAINMDPSGEYNGWDLPPVPNNNMHSALYRGLTNGLSAVSIANCGYVNCYYTGTVVGTASGLLLSISNSNNWKVVSFGDICITNYRFSVIGN